MHVLKYLGIKNSILWTTFTLSFSISRLAILFLKNRYISVCIYSRSHLVYLRTMPRTRSGDLVSIGHGFDSKFWCRVDFILLRGCGKSQCATMRLSGPRCLLVYLNSCQTSVSSMALSVPWWKLCIKWNSWFKISLPG